MEPNHCNILLVEDNPGDAALVQEASHVTNGVEFCVASDGTIALRMLAEGLRPDIILLDLNLPMLSGLDVLRYLKGNPELRRIPVVILSSSSAVEDVVEAYNLYANSYLTKPKDFNGYVDLVQRVRQFWLETVVLPHER